MQPDPERLYAEIMAQKQQPRPLEVQPEPVYRLPPPPDPGRRFVFAPDVIDEQQGLRLIEDQGAWKSQGFQALLEIPRPPEQIEPVVAPRPGHLALVLAAGVADGAVIETETYGRVAIRGKTQHVEQIARVDVESDPNDAERQVKKTTIRLKPATTLTLLAGDGTLVEMEGDEALLDFITTNKQALAAYLNNKFSPMYRFDMNGLSRFLDRIRLKGKYPALHGAEARHRRHHQRLRAPRQHPAGGADGRGQDGPGQQRRHRHGLARGEGAPGGGSPGSGDAGGVPAAPGREVAARTAQHPSRHAGRAPGPP